MPSVASAVSSALRRPASQRGPERGGPGEHLPRAAADLTAALAR